MKIITANLWDMGPAIAITTNGDVNSQGEAVMGRGVALQAKQRFPGIERSLAVSLRYFGNTPALLGTFGSYHIFTFPVKHHWRDKADLKLIEESADWLQVLLDDAAVLYMVWPGCGNGGLTKEKVRPIIEPILDDRFVVCEID